MVTWQLVKCVCFHSSAFWQANDINQIMGQSIHVNRGDKKNPICVKILGFCIKVHNTDEVRLIKMSAEPDTADVTQGKIYIEERFPFPIPPSSTSYTNECGK